jgi:3-hydroxybutyryl-CoA dehydrogenase
MENLVNKNNIETIGLVGLGLMGQGIAACLIRSGFRVIAYSRTQTREQEAKRHIAESLKTLASKKVVQEADIAGWEKRFSYVDRLEKLADCRFIIETVGEDLDLKRRIYKSLEQVISDDTVIASNTSGLSISVLQESFAVKDRFIGMHWSEPAEITRFLEIAPGKDTQEWVVQLTREVAEKSGKEPTVMKLEAQGLISNRLMYAMMREALYLVENGIADVEMIDRSFRNDIGWWATICGPFRWMDLTGLPIYAKVMEGLFPDLSNSVEVPKLMREKAESGGKFYSYSNGRENAWMQIWNEFTYDIREITDKYEKKINLSK